ncbi:hypothetical protein, partial [Nocardia sp. NPDC060255]|uniref:hypothetical protein n=1 Tax=Nocardia sp. NPDC060255 TaxID=3347085 RepID=UPI00365954C6
MDENLAADLAELPALLDAVRQSATDLLTGIETRPVWGGPQQDWPRAKTLKTNDAGGGTTPDSTP